MKILFADFQTLHFTVKFEKKMHLHLHNQSNQARHGWKWLRKMVEENFEISHSRSSRMAQFYYFLSIIPSPWLKKFLKFNILKKPQNGSVLLISYTILLIHHGWRKFWNSTFWKAPEWLNFTNFISIIPSPWWKKFLKFNILKSLGMAGFY